MSGAAEQGSRGGTFCPPSPPGRPAEGTAVPVDSAATAAVLRRRSLGRADRLLHVHQVPSRPGSNCLWPEWVLPELVAAFAEVGVDAPWQHQVQAATLARAGQHVVVATGTGSGKSLALWLPALSAVLEACDVPTMDGRRPSTLYLAPTKALAADQLAALQRLGGPGVRAAAYDGDTPQEERDWVRAHADVVLSNPDMLHRSILPGHQRWAGFLRSLQFVVVDECHVYRGVFGSHVSAVLRRLRRLCARYGANPTFLLASATVSDPAGSCARLIGLPVRAVTEDTAPRGATSLTFWEPPLVEGRGVHSAPVRRSATAEAAELMAELMASGVQTLTFVRSRKGAEAVAKNTARLLAEVDQTLVDRVAAYRGGYLPEERRALESALRSGQLLGLASTSALELGIDVSGLDAVVVAGWPGTRASFWQQIGRAGRAGRAGAAVLIAGDDPLDTYLVHHPEAVVGAPVEATVLDPDNPYILAPHLCAAAAELPLTDEDLTLFGPSAPRTLDRLVAAGQLRRRPTGWFWTRQERACDLADLRGAGAPAVRVVEDKTGRVLGTVDAGAAHSAVHQGAVYLHQGESYLVLGLDLEESVAMVQAAEVDYTTSARALTSLRILQTEHSVPAARSTRSFGVVEVTSQVVAFLRRRVLTGEVLGETPLELPERILRTRAVWWTLAEHVLIGAGLDLERLAGAAHAAEHAAIGLLPLVATCDRWDIGGISTVCHPDTGAVTIVVYDGHPGGAGFAERGFYAAQQWLDATRAAVSSCRCESGCPSCVQSPKCGNGNQPLDKDGAVTVLDLLLEANSS